MMVELLVFDLDDTLFPEHQFVMSGFRAVDRWLAANESVTGFLREADRLFVAGHRGRIFNEALESMGLSADPQRVSALVDIYRSHEPEIELHADAEWALDHFREICRLGIITDGYSVTQHGKCRALNLEHRVDAIICTDDLGRDFWKPNPAAFERLMQQFAVAAGGCVYVGDNPSKDFRPGNELGWLTVQIERSGGEYSGRAEPEDPVDRAQVSISSLLELPRVLPGSEPSEAE